VLRSEFLKTFFVPVKTDMNSLKNFLTYRLDDVTTASHCSVYFVELLFI